MVFAPHNVQVAPDGRTVWATAIPRDHTGTDQTVVLDAGTDTIESRIEVGSHLHIAHVVVDPGARFAYVTATDADQLLRIDAGTREMMARYELGPGRGPHGVRFCAGRLYVANMEAGTLSIVDPDTGAIEAEVDVGGAAIQTACTPDDRWAFVSVYDTAEVVRYDVFRGTLTRIALPAGAQGPVQLYPSPDGRRLYACDQGGRIDGRYGDRLFEIDVESATVVAEIDVGVGPHGVVVRDDGARAYVTNLAEGTVSVVDTELRTTIATTAVGDSPNGIACRHAHGGMP
jgi:YVTN family beta-propeller protein